MSVSHNKVSIPSFNSLSSTPSLLVAWELFRRGKRTRRDVLRYERYLEANLFRLEKQLQEGSYRHDKYEPFTICDPKQRLIHKATVKDRLVHQALVSAIEPSFERHFIHDSFSCRKGKGTHAAISRLKTFLRQASNNDTKTVYALKCDVKQFFASVDHGLLRQLLALDIDDASTLLLLDEVIGSFEMKPGKGIPLGNLTSQLFANIYLHELDWYAKHILKACRYLRYCDDFIIVSTDRQYLLGLIPQLASFLEERLGLTLHPNKIQLRSWHQGVDFLGYVAKPHVTVLRHKTKTRMLNKVSEANISSYLGVCSHANAKELSELLKMIIV